MNRILTLSLAAAAAALALQAQAQGQEMGRVLSVTPVTQQVAVPQQVCGNETVYTPARPTNGAGAVIGAIAGGILGHTVGGGGGQALATGIGAIGGAIVGDSLEGSRGGYQTVQRCTTQTRYDTQTLGYDVVYEYAGRQYSVRTQTDPGQWIPVTVQPAVQAPLPPAPVASYPDYATYPQAYDDGAVPPGVVVGSGPAVYAAPAIGATISYQSGGGWGHRGRHWR
ncbi:MAG: glycine zipper 2TM domain-containing protein [Comamonadaceae bacterium]|nr:glycine zipper 2TM domain-containing protein [Comamonadaceae bacterium]